MIFAEKPADLLLWSPKGQNRFLFQTENRTEAEAETCRVSHRFFFSFPGHLQKWCPAQSS